MGRNYERTGTDCLQVNGNPLDHKKLGRVGQVPNRAELSERSVTPVRWSAWLGREGRGPERRNHGCRPRRNWRTNMIRMFPLSQPGIMDRIPTFIGGVKKRSDAHMKTPNTTPRAMLKSNKRSKLSSEGMDEEVLAWTKAGAAHAGFLALPVEGVVEEVARDEWVALVPEEVARGKNTSFYVTSRSAGSCCQVEVTSGTSARSLPRRAWTCWRLCRSSRCQPSTSMVAENLGGA